jgi:hypothetical protein
MKINLYYFFIALYIGVCIVYITYPKPQIIIDKTNINENFINIECILK